MRAVSPACVHRPPIRRSTPAVASAMIKREMKYTWWGRTSDFHVPLTNLNGEASRSRRSNQNPPPSRRVHGRPETAAITAGVAAGVVALKGDDRTERRVIRVGGSAAPRRCPCPGPGLNPVARAASTLSSWRRVMDTSHSDHRLLSHLTNTLPGADWSHPDGTKDPVCKGRRESDMGYLDARSGGPNV